MEPYLDTIKTKIIGVLGFKLESPIHIGAGGEEVVRELIRLPSGEIVVPSSSWKGAFRFLSEQIAKKSNFKGLSGLAVKLYTENAGINYRGESKDLREEFYSFAKSFLKVLRGEVVENIPHTADELRSILMRLGYSEDEINKVEKAEELNEIKQLSQRMAEEYLALNCPIGKLYGNMSISGKVRFLDTFIRVASEIRPGVGIDRKSGKVMSNILYFTEIVASKEPVELKIIVDNLLPNNDDSKIFASTLEAMKTLNISIGARKSTGLGCLEFSEGKFYVFSPEEDHSSGGFSIGNPFKKAKQMSLEEFVKWLRA